MSKTVRDVMTSNPVTLDPTVSCSAAAKAMAERDIGDVLVQSADGQVAGIVTDRDIIVRALAQGRDPSQTRIGDICTTNVASVSPDDDMNTALRVMREKAVRRVPVVEQGKTVGIVTLGDLAQDIDPKSVLGQVSAAPPNN